MKKVLEGSHAVAEGVRLAKVHVVSAYPITPQTHIVERISDFCAQGVMDAKYIKVESEHSAMAVMLGAASTGMRTFTATSSQGLALMHEILHWASGARLPIVMGEVNRALGPGWNIWADQTDSLSQRDTGWIQMYCETGQEVLDTTIQAFKLAEAVNLPAMVILDAFFLSHTYEPVDVPDQEEVDRFLPAITPHFKLDTKDPYALNQLAPPGVYMEMRYDIQLAMERALEEFSLVEDDFETVFGRRYNPVEPYLCEDAEIVFITSGTVTGTCRQFVSDIRKSGEKVGILKIKLFRPFPAELVRKSLKNVPKVAVVDRNFSFGAGGIFAQEVKSVLCNMDKKPIIFGYIAGLGGRDITLDTLADIFNHTKNHERPDSESIWMGLKKGE